MPKILEFLGDDPRPREDTIAKRLVFFRTTMGWSQQRFAEALKVNPSTLSRWEQGKREPDGEFLQRVEALIGARGLVWKLKSLNKGAYLKDPGTRETGSSPALELPDK